jgi:hypothetical protein
VEGLLYGKAQHVRLVLEPVAQGIDTGDKIDLLPKGELFNHLAGRDFKTEVLKLPSEIQVIGRVTLEEFMIELKQQEKSLSVVDVAQKHEFLGVPLVRRKIEPGGVHPVLNDPLTRWPAREPAVEKLLLVGRHEKEMIDKRPVDPIRKIREDFVPVKAANDLFFFDLWG